MKTFNEIDLNIFIPQIENNNKIYIPKDGKKSKFLNQLKRLGRVTRVCNPREEVQTSYRLYTNENGIRLSTSDLYSILDLIPLKEEVFVELYFILVEMGYHSTIYGDMVSYFYNKVEDKSRVLDTLTIEGLDSTKLQKVKDLIYIKKESKFKLVPPMRNKDYKINDDDTIVITITKQTKWKI